MPRVRRRSSLAAGSVNVGGLLVAVVGAISLGACGSSTPVDDGGKSCALSAPCPTCDGGTNTCSGATSGSVNLLDWAEWPMPNGSVDSPPAPNLESYTDNGDGTVTDNVTGLMWQQMGSWSTTWGSASTPGTAQHYCATVSTAGHAGGGVLVRDVGTQLAELRLVRLLLQRRRSELPR